MRKLNPKSLFLTFFLAGVAAANGFSQQNQGSLSQAEKINRLLEVKTEMAKDDEIGDRYKIQLFYGDNGEADEVIKEYRKKYSYPSLIAYEEPNYKVWVGNFRNRLEADRALREIKNDFPSAFIPQPRRR